MAAWLPVLRFVVWLAHCTSLDLAAHALHTQSPSWRAFLAPPPPPCPWPLDVPTAEAPTRVAKDATRPRFIMATARDAKRIWVEPMATVECGNGCNSTYGIKAPNLLIPPDPTTGLHMRVHWGARILGL